MGEDLRHQTTMQVSSRDSAGSQRERITDSFNTITVGEIRLDDRLRPVDRRKQN